MIVDVGGVYCFFPKVDVTFFCWYTEMASTLKRGTSFNHCRVSLATLVYFRVHSICLAQTGDTGNIWTFQSGKYL